MNQARALGESWYSTLRTPVHKIYASDLKRAHSTAVQLVAPRRALPPSDPLACPPIETTPLIREQHFGVAEGKLWSAGPVPINTKMRRASASASASASNDYHQQEQQQEQQEPEVYETIRNRHDRFSGGESLDDLALRAQDAVERFVWPHLDDAIAHCAYTAGTANSTNSADGTADGATNGNGNDGEAGGRGTQESGEAAGLGLGLGYHVVLVSHGLCISEMVAAIFRRSANAGATARVRLKGLMNTGWTRVQIRPLVSRPFIISPTLMRCNELV